MFSGLLFHNRRATAEYDAILENLNVKEGRVIFKKDAAILEIMSTVFPGIDVQAVHNVYKGMNGTVQAIDKAGRHIRRIFCPEKDGP